MISEIEKIINESIQTKRKLIHQSKKISEIAKIIVNAYKSGKKVIAFGNGGSAADAQHLVAELVCRFEKNRTSLPAIALTTNTSTLTALGNDFSFNKIFSRQVESLANEGDIVIAISTSGNSKNVIDAVKIARKKRTITIGLTGKTGGALKEYVDYIIRVPSNNTARIQESHITIIHAICHIIEKELFN